MLSLTEQEKAEILSNLTSQSFIDETMEQFNEPIEPITMIYTFKKGKKGGKWPDQIFVYYVGKIDTRWSRKISSMPEVARRLGNREECIANHFTWRYKFLTYKNWEGLIEDEIACGSDEMFIQKLKETSLKYQFNT